MPRPVVRFLLIFGEDRCPPHTWPVVQSSHTPTT
jgi:hypothetical protein